MSDPTLEEGSNARAAHDGARPADIADPLYCRADTVRFPLGGSQLVYAKFSREALVLQSEIIVLLDECANFDTLEHHAQKCLRTLVPEHRKVCANLPALIRHELAQLIEAGLLVSAGDLMSRARQLSCSASSTPHPISTVGVVTHNRPASVERCLRSLVANVEEYARAPGFVVIDDSDDHQTRERVRQALCVLSERHRFAFAYGGLEQKRRFAERLASAGGVPRDVIEFALFDTENCGDAIGANRNALLLHTAGETVFGVDDDVVCRVSATGETDTALGFDDDWESMRFRFFSDRERASESVHGAGRDVLAVHEQLLGKDLRGCVATFSDDAAAPAPPGLHFEGMPSRPLRDLQANRGRVLATFTGVVGDSGMDTPLTYLALGADSRRRLVNSETEYRAAMASREVLRVVSRPLVSANPWCVTTAWGFDNRVLLPPFVPVGRGEDDVWGFTVQACYGDAYFGFLPYALLHAPLESRAYSPAWIVESTAHVRVYQIILVCLMSFQTWPGAMNETERMRALGRHLVALGEMRQLDFEEYVRLHVWRMHSEFVTLLEHRLRSFDNSPEFWARDVREYIAALRQSLPREDYIVPGELLRGRSVDEARRLSQQLVRKYGQLLLWWPAIIETAKQLRAQGQPLVQSI
ncbi:MAG: glycosyltransferase family 2 protein [Acidobacteriota bacterium]|nr:glycosyltransferase family 2 protein [Acidobacteriota bacterium]